MGKPKPVAQGKSHNKKDSFFMRSKTTKHDSSNKGSTPRRIDRKASWKHTTRNNPSMSKPSTSGGFFVEKASNGKVGGYFTDTKGEMATKASKKDLTTENFQSNIVGSMKPSKNSLPEETKIIANEKKPFNKRKWRMQKYSKKYKLKQWEERRKKTITREYYKQMKNDQPNFDVQKVYEDDSEQESEVTGQLEVKHEETQMKDGNRSFPKPFDRYKHMQQEKEARKAEALKKKEERDKIIREYKKKKLEKYKKLNQRTRKGQPVMKHRMELLFEQIQKSLC